jgi:hypothetical protein
VSPIELPDKSIAAVGAEAIIVSTDQGHSWTEASPLVPIDMDQQVRGLVYSSQRKEFYIWHYNCSSFNNDIPIAADAVMKFAYP